MLKFLMLLFFRKETLNEVLDVLFREPTFFFAFRLNAWIIWSHLFLRWAFFRSTCFWFLSRFIWLGIFIWFGLSFWGTASSWTFRFLWSWCKFSIPVSFHDTKYKYHLSKHTTYCSNNLLVLFVTVHSKYFLTIDDCETLSLINEISFYFFLKS